MQIYDEYNIKDIGYTPKGIVKLVDNNNNIIFEKHNLVVNNGRKLMYELFLKYFFNNFTSTILTENPQLNVYLSYDENNTQTLATTGIADIHHGIYLQTSIKNMDELSIDGENRSITFNIGFAVNNNFLETQLKFKSEEVSEINKEYFRFNQVFITFKDMNNDQDELFSRVAMDPVFMKNGMKYQLEYTLYF